MLMPVPGSFAAGSDGALKDYAGAAWYRCVVRIPESWKMPAADTKLAGTLERVDCSADSAQLQIRLEHTTRTFQVRSSDRIQIRGASGAQVELTCGALRNRPRVEIEFTSQSGAVAAITFLTR